MGIKKVEPMNWIIPIAAALVLLCFYYLLTPRQKSDAFEVIVLSRSLDEVRVGIRNLGTRLTQLEDQHHLLETSHNRTHTHLTNVYQKVEDLITEKVNVSQIELHSNPPSPFVPNAYYWVKQQGVEWAIYQANRDGLNLYGEASFISKPIKHILIPTPKE